jgi:predicted ATP-grasp superfamily ATP-dependent carboligase
MPGFRTILSIPPAISPVFFACVVEMTASLGVEGVVSSSNVNIQMEQEKHESQN